MTSQISKAVAAGGPDGVIKKIWLKVKSEEHAAEVLAAFT